MAGIGQAELVNHVGSDAIGAQGHRVSEPGWPGIAHRVIHVGSGVVDNRASQTVLVSQVDAMDDQPVVGSQVAEAVSGRRVDLPFGNVDVDPDAVVDGQAGRRFEGAVRAGEGGVDADHAPTPLDQKPFVLGQATSGPVRTVAVGDPVGARHPDPHSGTGLGDDAQRPFDGLG